MAKLVDKRNSIEEMGIYNGQVREDSFGRIVMVIRDERWTADAGRVAERVTKLLVLKERSDGGADEFTTIPYEHYTESEIIIEFPKVLDVEVVIKGEK